MKITRILSLSSFICLLSFSLPAQLSTQGKIYELDTYHSLLDFTARHKGFGRVRGTFNDYRASMYFIPDNLAASSVHAVIEVASLDTQDPGRDDHLKKVFFDVEKYPQIHFRSTKIVKEEDQFILYGELQIKDVTKTLRLPLEVLTLEGIDQWQNQRIVLETSLKIDRRDFNVVYDNKFWDGIVSNEIQIDISFGASAYNARNEIFPWRKNSIGTFIKNQVPEIGLEETIAKVRDLHKTKGEEYQFGVSHFHRAGLALAQAGQAKEGVAILQLGIELNETTASAVELADLHANVAEIFLHNDDKDQASEAVQQALEKDPWNPSAKELKRRLKL